MALFEMARHRRCLKRRVNDKGKTETKTNRLEFLKPAAKFCTIKRWVDYFVACIRTNSSQIMYYHTLRTLLCYLYIDTQSASYEHLTHGHLKMRTGAVLGPLF